jgi:hypothetical protein
MKFDMLSTFKITQQGLHSLKFISQPAQKERIKKLKSLGSDQPWSSPFLYRHLQLLEGLSLQDVGRATH